MNFLKKLTLEVNKSESKVAELGGILQFNEPYQTNSNIFYLECICGNLATSLDLILANKEFDVYNVTTPILFINETFCKNSCIYHQFLLIKNNSNEYIVDPSYLQFFPTIFYF